MSNPSPVVFWPEEVEAGSVSQQALEAINHYLQTQRVDEQLAPRLAPLYLPMANWLLARRDNSQPLVIGINGAQGSGKSTLAGLLQVIFEQCHKLRVARLSIDDLYHDKQTRQQLANKVHPLLRTRGVPGTHDIELGLSIFKKLRSRKQTTVDLPRFDKSIDDRLPTDKWESIVTPVDIILFEGWCVGATPQKMSELSEPINELETEEDTDADWRTYVNNELAERYQTLFQQIDILLMLKTPSMKQVLEWRGLQDKQQANVMGTEQLQRFIMHFERLTRHQLAEMPARADAVFSLDLNHQIADISLKGT